MCVSNTVLGGADPLTFRVRTSVEAAASRTKMVHGLASGTSLCHSVEPHTVFAEKTDIEFTAHGTTQAAAASFGMILLPEKYNRQD